MIQPKNTIKMINIIFTAIFLLLFFVLSMPIMHKSAIRNVHNTFWWYGYNHPPPVIRLNGISVIKAKANNLPIYFLMFRVRKYPSAIIKAKIGKANLPTFVIQCWPVKIVAHKWSNSMNAIARTCRPKEVIPIFLFPQLINFFHSSFTRHHDEHSGTKEGWSLFPCRLWTHIC